MNNTSPFSYTRLETFKQCPRKYSYQYVERPDVPKKSTIEAHLGTVCHATVQQIYRDLSLSKIMSLEDTEALYQELWDKDKPENLAIIKERYEEADYRNTGLRYVRNFYEQNKPFDDGKTLGIEKQVHISIGGETSLIGYIDRLVDHGDGVLEIIDYKTNKDLPSLQDLETNWQLPLYHLGLTQMMPEIKKVTCTWHFLAHEKKLSIERTQKDLDDLKEDIIVLIGQIQSTKDFEARASALCSWCDYEILCPARKHMLEAGDLPEEEFQKEDGVKLVNEYMKLKEQLTALERDCNEVGDKLLRYAEEQNLMFIRGSQDKIRIWTKAASAKFLTKEENPGVDRAVAAILRKHKLWDRYAAISLFSLARAIDNRELPAIVIRELEPFFRRSKIQRLYPAKIKPWD